MKDIKAVGLITLSKKLRGVISDIKNNEGISMDDIGILYEIQRRLNFIVKHKHQCDCPWSSDCEHLDVLGNCGMRYGK